MPLVVRDYSVEHVGIKRFCLLVALSSYPFWEISNIFWCMLNNEKVENVEIIELRHYEFLDFAIKRLPVQLSYFNDVVITISWILLDNFQTNSELKCLLYISFHALLSWDWSYPVNEMKIDCKR